MVDHKENASSVHITKMSGSKIVFCASKEVTGEWFNSKKGNLVMSHGSHEENLPVAESHN
jgi:hypothetical protein